MQASQTLLLALASLFLIAVTTLSDTVLKEKRQLASDLEVSGALAGLPADSTRYLTRDDLLALPHATFSASNDSNFSGSTKILGIRLEDLARNFAASPASDMVVAICDDGYRANYPQAYLAAHHPVLVLQINGEPPERWPKSAGDHASDMGPFMISNPKFKPSFKVLAHTDETQIPWGVVRIEFRDEKAVFGAIAPRGPHAQDRDVQDGYAIAQQNCFRCHNSGDEGGKKSGRSWESLGAMADASPGDFAGYIRAPQKVNPQAQMPGNPLYDDATLAALTAYFQTFSQSTKP